MFDIEQELFIDMDKRPDYFYNVMSNAFMKLFTRNFSLIVPITGYIYAFWPIKFQLNKTDSFSYKMDIKSQENDEDIMVALKNTFR